MIHSHMPRLSRHTYGIFIRVIQVQVVLAIQASLLPLASFGSTPTDIKAAWEKYSEGVESLQYECKLDRTQMIAEKQSTSLGRDPAETSKKPVTTKSIIIFSVSGDKISCSRSGEFASDHSPSPHKETQKRVYDGAENRYLFIGGGAMPVGGIASSTVPDDSLLKHVELFPIWMAYSPFSLLREENGYLVNEMTLQENASWEGAPCAVASIPTPNKDVICLFYLDPSKDYRPIGYEMLNKGKVMQSVNMRYIRNKDSAWSLAGWLSHLFDSSGEPIVSVTGSVQGTKINEPLSGDEFLIDFPEGTHVDWNGKPFIQGPGNDLRPLSEKEFRRAGPDIIAVKSPSRLRAIALAMTSCVVVYLGVAVFKKRSANNVK